MDDDLMVRQIGGRVLRHLGHTCEFATDGEEAIRMHQAAVAAGAPFDLVIMDLTIPGGMGGKEAIEELRRITPDVKAIVSSGYANDPIMADFTAHGFCGVVAKPWDTRELGDTIARVMDASC